MTHSPIKKGSITEDTLKLNDSFFVIKQFSKNDSIIFRLYLSSLNPLIKNGKYESYFNNKLRC